MSTLYVDNLEPNLGSRVLAAGHVVQTIFQNLNPSEVAVSSGTYTDLESLSITPTATSSKIVVFSAIPSYTVGSSVAYNWHGTRLLRGSTVLIGSHADSNGPYGYGGSYSTSFVNVASSANMILSYVDSPATTSAITYKVQGATYGSSVTAKFYHDASVYNARGSLIIQEIAQ
jgi:hypothetical protein